MQSVSITTDGVGSNLDQDEVYSLQHYVIKFVSDLQQVGGFLPVRHDNTELLLEVALSTITQTTNGFIQSPFVWGYAYNLIRSCWDYVRKA
jgi:hypothetical protein